MAIEKEINIVVKESGIDNINKKIDNLENSFNDLDATSKTLMSKPVGENFFDGIKDGVKSAGNYFDNLKQKILNFGNSKKGIDDVDKSLENLTKTNKGVTSSMGEISGAVLDNGGAMGLLNDATGGLAMTVKDAVEASALFTKSEKAKGIMTAISTTIIGTSTGAIKAFRIALAATGIGLVVIGLGYLIANFEKVSKWANSFAWIKNLGGFISGLTESITDFVGATSEADRALEKLTAQADKSLAMNKKFLAEEGDQINKYTKAKIDAKNAYNEAIKEEGSNQVKLAAKLNRELLAINKQHNEDLAKERKDKQDKLNEANKVSAEKAKQDRLKANEDAKKALDEKIKSDAQKAFELNEEQKQSVIDVEEFLNGEKDKKAKKEEQEAANKFARMVYDAEQEKALDDKKKADKILAEKTVQDALVLMGESTASIFDSLEALGLKKSKAAQTIRKGIALAQIAVDTGKAIGSAVELATKAGVAAQTAAPFVPGIGTIATIASYASSSAMIFSNVAKAKQLLGGGGGGGSTG